MKSTTFKNFQVGIVDDPSVEDQGGFEFASGMDIFSEPGVVKACPAMEEVSYGASASPTDVPLAMVDTTHTDGTVRLYVIAGDKVLQATSQSTFNLFLTNANGTNLGLAVWNGYVIYAHQTKIGRTPVNDASTKNDSYITTLDSDTEYHPMIQQGGTLKIGAGRYVASLDESFNFTAQALKLPVGYRIKTIVEYLNYLYAGTKIGAGGGGVLTHDSSVFSWKGIVLSSGSALPDAAYPMKERGMNALVSDGRRLLAFPDKLSEILVLDGVSFSTLRKLSNFPFGQLYPNAVEQHFDNILIGKSGTTTPGVFQLKGDVICQAYVPVGATPGDAAEYNIGFVKTAFNGSFYMGYYKAADNSYHIAIAGSNLQNNAMIRMLWHRQGTDRLKRWYGVKPNFKPLASGCSVAVAYRTSRDAAFTDSGYTITSANQDKPVILPVQPRSREIQWKFTYTTNGGDTPELLSYDNLYDVLNATR